MANSAVFNLALNLRKALITKADKSPAFHIREIFTPVPLEYVSLHVCDEMFRALDVVTSNVSVDNINGEIRSIAEWVATYYCPKKDSGTTPNSQLRDELLLFIRDRVRPLALRILDGPAIGVLFIVASVHLLLLQELVTVDPDAPNPPHLTYNHLVNLSRQYSQEAMGKFNHVMRKRHGFITEMKYVRFMENGIVVNKVEWTDLLPGYERTEVARYGQEGAEPVGTTVTKAQQSRTAYVINVDVRMHHAMNDPLGFLLVWQQLQDQPMPVTSYPV